MDKRVRLGIGAGLFISVGFGLGWFARGRAISPVEPGPAPRQQSEYSEARVVVSVAGVPVLRYEGPTLDAALTAGNKQTPSKALADSVKPDAKNPLFATVSARIDINETFRSGGASSSPHFDTEPVELVLVRSERNASDWALTPEAIAAIQSLSSGNGRVGGR
jgi:hypothetical protein